VGEKRDKRKMERKRREQRTAEYREEERVGE